MPVSIGPRIGVEGVKQFRQAFLQVTQEAKRFDAEMKRITATFDANDSAMTKNRKIREQLTRQITEQKRVVQIASDTYEEAVKAETKAAENYEKAQERAQKKIGELEQEKKKLTKTVEKETKDFKSQELQVSILQERYDKAKENLQKYADTLGKSHPYVKKLTRELDEQGKELDEEKAKLEQQRQAVNNATKAVRENEAEQRKVAKTVEDASNSLYRASARTDKYATDMENAKTKLGQFQEQLKNLPNNLEIVSGYLKDLGGTLEGIGDNMTKYITAPLATLGTYGVKNASNLTDGMAKIYTIATETQEPMAEMREGLIELSDSTGFALDDLTQAAYQAVSASVDAGDAVEFMGNATKLARAGFTTTEKSVDLLTTIMNSYGKETYDAAYLSDLLLRTQNDGKTIVDQLAASMGTVIPTAAAYNVGIEQVAAAYATMTKQGVNTARATTMLNALFTELEKPDKDAAILLDDLTGKTFAQLMKEGKSLGEVLGMLYKNLDKDSEAFANLFVNVRSARAANALMADDVSILNYELERMADVTGQTDYALEMLETPSLKARKALNKLKNSTVDLGDTIIGDLYPAFEKAVSIVDDFRGWVKNLNKEQKKSIVRWGALVGAIGPALKLTGGLISGIGGVADSFVKMRKATQGASTWLKAVGAIIDTDGLGFSALVPQIGLVIGGITALGIAMKINSDNFMRQYEAEYGLTEQDKELIETTNTLHQSRLDMKSATDQEIVSINQNSTLAEQLVKKYNDLVDSTGLATESSQALADMYLNQLAEALGLERDQVEELIDANGKLSTSIDEVIQKKRAEAMLKAHEDDYLDAVAKQADAQKQVADLTGRYAQKQLEVNHLLAEATHWEQQATKEQELFGYTTDETAEKSKNASLALETAQDALDKLGGSLNDAEEDLIGYNTTIANYEGLSASVLSGSVYEIQASLQELVDGFIHAEDGTRESLENQVKNAKKSLDEIKRKFDKHEEGITQDMVDAYMKIYTDSEEELSKWEQMNNEKLDGFVDDIRQRKEPIRQATSDTMGVIPTETEKQLNKTKTRADSGMQSVVNQLRGHISGMTSAGIDLATAITNVFWDNKYFNQMFSAGSHFMEGFVNGLKAVNVTKTSNKIMTDTIQASKQTLGEQSPSKVMYQVGEYFTQGFANGIASENNLAKQSARNMAQSAVDSSWMTSNWTPTGIGYATQGMSSNTRNITAPINVNVNVNGNVDDVDALADVIADRINTQILRKNEVFA